MRRLTTLLLSFLISINSSFLFADSAFTKRADVQRFIHNLVKQHGFSEQEVTQVMNDVRIQPQIIESMNRPYEKKPWNVYKQIFLTSERVQAGMAFWRANQAALNRAEEIYHVPANIIVAIIGVETLYGKHQGNYRVLDALSTLAFDYPKRSPFFTKELQEYFLLCREHRVSPTQYLGSYAGAMGKPQFMPSSYRYYAAQFDENPKIDLMNDDSAVIASVANYFHKHGWKLNEGIAQPAEVVGLMYKKFNTAQRIASYRINELEAAGIRPLTAATNIPTKVGLVELTTQTGQEFWLTYPNFYVITRYNTSPQYAMAVYLLSQELKSQWAQHNPVRKHAYV